MANGASQRRAAGEAGDLSALHLAASVEYRAPAEKHGVAIDALLREGRVTIDVDLVDRLTPMTTSWLSTESREELREIGADIVSA
ncbi:MAG TPA: hypothetical protein VGV07_14350 [Devosia sp.]|jgi:hypothetical protein|uniref:hypothetical protein n=1 Tax=Devosia sp. TaxID=1871048 RepID=UPI002DDDA0DB|nr:hypothetical protein [Devosia sp.]HEV2516433.1 hypothetical protein [Devosia sp.]